MPQIARLVLIALLLLAASAPSIAADATVPLRLVGTDDGKEFVPDIVADGQLMMHDAAGTRAVPSAVHWRLEGDLRAHADLIVLRPAHEILAHPVRSASGTMQARKYGIIRIDRAKRWKDLRKAMIVFAWVVDGRVTWVDVRAVAPMAGPSASVAAITALELDAETARGFPIALAFADGQFLKPEPAIRQEPLRRAMADIYLGSPEDFARSLAALASVNAAVDTLGLTLLHLAAEAGNDAAVRVLCASGARIGATGKEQLTPITFAAGNGRLHTVRTILAAGGPGRRSRHDTARDWATINGHADVAFELLGEDGRNIRSGAGKKVLLAALRVGDYAVVAKLLSGEAPEGWVKAVPRTFWQVVGYGDPALTRILISGGLKADDDVDGVPLLVLAAKAGDAASVGLLLEAGANIDRAARDGSTALMEAILSGDRATVEALLHAGANARAQDRSGRTAMDGAAMMRWQDAIDLLQSRGVPLAGSVAGSGRLARNRRNGDDSWSEYAGHPVHELTEVDVMPVAKATPTSEVIRYINRSLERGTPIVSGNPITGEITERSGSFHASGPGVAEPVRSDYWGVATLVVEPDGTVGSVQVVRANPPKFVTELERTVRRYEFSPGQRNGQRLRTRITLAITVPE